MLDRQLIVEGLDKRKNDSFVYLVRWRGQAAELNSWVHYENLRTPELVVEFKRKHKLVAYSKKSPKRLQRTIRF